MRGFFLPQPASWPGTPFATLRMTALLGVAAVLGGAALLGMTAPAVTGGWTGSADKVALFQLGSVSIGPRPQRRRLALMAAMMSSSVMDSGRGRWTGA